MLLNTAEFAALAQVPVGTLLNMTSTGGLVPAVWGDGVKNKGHRWTIAQALAVVVGRSLKKRGVRQESAGEIMNFLLSFHQEGLEHLFSQGVAFAVVIGDQVIPRLVGDKEANEAAAGSTVQTALRFGVPAFVLDVAHLFDLLKEQAAKLIQEQHRQPVTQ
jgi:hypothetical protein